MFLGVFFLVFGMFMFLAFQGGAPIMSWLLMTFLCTACLIIFLKVFRPRDSASADREWERRLLEEERRDRDELELPRMRSKRKAWDERDLV